MDFAGMLGPSSADEDAPYPKILQWSVEKISEARRRKGGADLRRNLLIANVVFKARSGILQQRTRQFLQEKPQLQPPAPVQEEPATLPTLLQEEPATPPALLQEDPASPPASAFGYGAAPSDASSDVVPASELSASADAIVMSSVELSIQEFEEEPVGDAGDRSADKGPRKRKILQQLQQQQQQQHQLEQLQEQLEQQAPRPHSPPKRTRQEEVFVLQNSFCDLTVQAAVEADSAQQQLVPAYMYSCQFGGHFFGIGAPSAPSLACPT